MKRSIQVIASSALMAASLGGCSSESMHRRSAQGGVAGAAGGAILGGLGGGGKGAAAGAIAGGIVGAGVGAYLDKRKAELEKVGKTEKTPDGNLVLKMDNKILFGFNRADVKRDGQGKLKELGEILAKYPDEKIRIAGYTDNIGSASYNQKLSQERASSVKKILEEYGVADNRIMAVGLGESKAKASSAEGREQERRVEIGVDVKAPASVQNGAQGA